MTTYVVRGPSGFEKSATLLIIIGPFLATIFGVYSLWGWGVNLPSLYMLAGFYIFTVLGVTTGFHRLFTHRAFEAVPSLRLALAIAGSMAVEGPLLRWVSNHRAHHEHSDSEGDPHSPHLHGGGVVGMIRGFFHAHLGWLISFQQPQQEKYIKALKLDPILVFVDKYFFLWVSLGLVLPALILGLITMSWWGALLGFFWGGLVRICLVHHVTWSINSVCHLWGTRRFETEDHSRNNALFGALGLGEGWHNNHHGLQSSARHGLYWYEIDFTWYFILALKKLGLVSKVKVFSPQEIKWKKERLKINRTAKTFPRKSFQA